MRNNKYLLGLFIAVYVVLLIIIFSSARGPFILHGEISFTIISSAIILILMGVSHWIKMREKSSHKKFIFWIVSELIFILIFYFLQMYWSTPCDTPNFFHPFGRHYDTLCIQVLARAPSPFFYLGVYALILTIVLYIVYLIRNKLRKKK